MPISFKAVHPKYYDVQAITTAIQRAADRVAEGMLDDFEKTTRTWNHRVEFSVISEMVGKDYVVAVGTNDEIYRYVAQGTKPHVIRPRNHRRLAFRIGYRTKTSPRNLGSRGGGASGPRVFARVVHHPGTEAREFSDTISKRWKRSSIRLIQEAINSVVGKLVRK